MKLHILIGSAALLLAAPAVAQDFSFPAPDYVGGWFSTTMPDITMDSPSGVSANDIQSSSGKKSSHSSTIPQVNPRSLQYNVSLERRRQNIARFIGVWSKTDAEGATKARPLLNDAIPQIDRAMRASGLRADNVADAYAVWWITAWEAVNMRDMGNNARMVQSVKQQATNALLSTPQFASATDAQKQEMAEVLLIQAAMIDASEEVFANDSAQLRALSRAVNQGAMAMDRDLDLTKMTLTPNGFVPRSGGRSDAGDVSGDGSQLAATEEGGSNLALYAVAGTGLLAGVFALGKGLAKRVDPPPYLSPRREGDARKTNQRTGAKHNPLRSHKIKGRMSPSTPCLFAWRGFDMQGTVPAITNCSGVKRRAEFNIVPPKLQL